MSTLFIVEKGNSLTEAMIRLAHQKRNLAVVVNEPGLKSLLAKEIPRVQLMYHLIPEEQDIEIYAKTESFLRALHQDFALSGASLLEGLNVPDLNLLDAAYSLRHVYWLDEAARKIFPGQDWIYGSIRYRYGQGQQEQLPYRVEVVSSDQLAGQPSAFRTMKKQIQSGLSSAKRSIRSLLSGNGVSQEEIEHSAGWFNSDRKQKGKRILFVLEETASGLAIASFGPLLSKITEDPGLNFLVVTSTSYSAKLFQKAGIKAISPPQRKSREIVLHQEQCMAHLQQAIDNKKKQYRIGIPEYNLLLNYMDYNCDSIAFAYDCIPFLKEVYEGYEPDILVTNNDRSVLGKAAALLAKQRGIPSMLYYPCLIRVHSWFRDCYCDAIGVYGEHGADCVKANGHGSKTLYRIGNPKYDVMVAIDREEARRSIRKQLQMSPEQKLVLLVGTLVVKGSEKWLSEVIRSVGQHQFPNISFVVKPHPGDLLEEYQVMVTNGHNRVKILTEPVFNYELIAAADVVVTDFSTLGSEALLMRKPVIAVNFNQEEHCVRFEESGAAIAVKSIGQFMQAVSELTTENSMVLRNLNYDRAELFYGEKIDGLAADRFLSAILDLGFNR